MAPFSFAPMRLSRLLALSLIGLAGLSPVATLARPTIIAHRGASGYLPEHTLEAYAFAYGAGVDFIEQDVVLSRDDVLVVCHDIHIDTVTDVATRFPARARADGRFYAIDFTWPELRTLQVRERFDEKTGKPVFPLRFPHNGGGFRLCTMDEAILLIQGLNRSTGRTVGLYPEIKAPAWHRSEGKDPGRALLTLLDQHGYREATDPIYVQCFDPSELKRLRHELKTRLKLVQLLGENAWKEADIDYVALRSSEGLKEIATYANGVGPYLGHLVTGRVIDGRPEFSPFVRDAHAAGLAVHPYTLRADQLPPGIASLDALIDLVVGGAGADGLFIDQGDVAVRHFTTGPRN